MSAIQPVPQTFPLVTRQGTYTPAFKTFLDQLLRRVGGVTGGTLAPLADGPTVAWDVDQAPVAFVTLGGSRVVAAPANQVGGLLHPYRLFLAQDAAGGRTVTWAGAFRFPAGTPPTLTAAPFAVDQLCFASDGTNTYLVSQSMDLR